MNHQGKTISVPIANLHVGCLPMVSAPAPVAFTLFSFQGDFNVSPILQVSLGEFELKAPVTIRLKAGEGPVSVSGLHLIGKETGHHQPNVRTHLLGSRFSAEGIKTVNEHVWNSSINSREGVPRVAEHLGALWPLLWGGGSCDAARRPSPP